MVTNKSIAYCLLLFTPYLSSHVAVAQISVNVTEHAAVFTEQSDSILSYQIAPKSINGNFTRNHYIHPLYALDGTVLTEDFPDDHPHHRGIFWAWHQLFIGDKRMGDGWEIEDFSWEVVRVNEIATESPDSEIESVVYWKSPLWTDQKGREKPFVKEVTHIRVSPTNDSVRFIKIAIELLALVSELTLGGSEDEKGYGGFSVRINLPEDVVFTGPQGSLTPKNLAVKSDGWVNMIGNIGGNNKQGLTVFAHAANPGFPNPWILRNTKSMQNAVYPYPGKTPVPLSMEAPLTLRYLLVVHDGTWDPKSYGQFK